MDPNQIIARPAGRGLLTAVILSFAFATGCSDSGGGGGTDPVPDTTPDAFILTDQSGAFLATLIESDPITVNGINQAADISITGGEYRIGNGAYTDESGTVSNGQAVTVRVESSADLDTAVEATLTIGGVSDTFTVTTRSVDAGGIYNGTGEVNSGTALSDVHGMIHNERFMIFSEAGNVLYDGQIQTYSGNDITAMVDVYKDGVNSQQATATGTVSTADSMELTLSGTGYGNGTLSLTYDSLYERDATLARFATDGSDIWGGQINSVTSGTNIGLRAPATDNTFSANTSVTPCIYENGAKTIPNDAVNIYIVSFDAVDAGVGECNHIGEHYTGLATVVDESGTDDLMWFAASNGVNSSFSMLDHIED